MEGEREGGREEKGNNSFKSVWNTRFIPATDNKPAPSQVCCAFHSKVFTANSPPLISNRKCQ